MFQAVVVGLESVEKLCTLGVYMAESSSNGLQLGGKRVLHAWQEAAVYAPLYLYNFL